MKIERKLDYSPSLYDNMDMGILIESVNEYIKSKLYL